MSTALEVLRIATVIVSMIALGTNAFVAVEAARVNRRGHQTIAAWAYPVTTALTSLAIVVGRTIAFIKGEPEWATTDIAGPILAAAALFAGWQATSSLAFMEGAQEARDLLARVAEGEVVLEEEHD